MNAWMTAIGVTVSASIIVALLAAASRRPRRWLSRRWRAVSGYMPVTVDFETDPANVFDGPMDWVTFAVWIPDQNRLPPVPESSRDLLRVSQEFGAIPALWQTVRVRIQAEPGETVIIDSIQAKAESDPDSDPGGVVLIAPTGGADLPYWNVTVTLDPPEEADLSKDSYPLTVLESAAQGSEGRRRGHKRTFYLRNGEVEAFTVEAAQGRTDKRWWLEFGIRLGAGQPLRILRCPPEGEYFRYRAETNRPVLHWDRTNGAWVHPTGHLE